MEEHLFGPCLFSSVEFIVNKHANEGRDLLDTALWSLRPPECFEAAMVHGSRIILVSPAGKMYIDQHLAASASELGGDARPLESSTKKDLVRKKQIV